MADYWNVGIVAMMCVLIGGFGVFIAAMPSQLLYAEQFKQSITPSDWEFSSSDYYHMNQTVNLMAAWDYIAFNFAVAPTGPQTSIEFRVYFRDIGPAPVERRLEIYWVTWYFWWMVRTEYMKWHNTRQTYWIVREDIVNGWDTTKNTSAFKLTSTNPCINAYFKDINKTRNNIGAAWDAGSLDMMIGFGVDNVTIAVNSLTYLSNLLFFQAWDIFGSGAAGIILNALIAIPIWAAIIYIVTRIALLFIPFLGD